MTTKKQKGFAAGQQGTGRPKGAQQVRVKRGSNPHGNPQNLRKGGKVASNVPTEQEKAFIENLLLFMPKSEALRQAGYLANNPTSYANELLNKKRVVNYYAMRKAEEAELNKDIHGRIRKELEIMAFTNTSELATLKTVEQARAEAVDFMVKGGMSKEDAVKEAAKLTASELAFDKLLKGNNGRLVKSIKVGKYGIEFQLHSKDAALDMLAKHTGFYEADNAQKNKGAQVEIYIPDNNRDYTGDNPADENKINDNA